MTRCAPSWFHNVSTYCGEVGFIMFQPIVEKLLNIEQIFQWNFIEIKTEN
jgi:hypothetical protein